MIAYEKGSVPITSSKFFFVGFIRSLFIANRTRPHGSMFENLDFQPVFFSNHSIKFCRVASSAHRRSDP